jgi:hypothetical protein
VVLFTTRDWYLFNIEPSITSRIAAMAAPTPIPALAPVESPEWEGPGGNAAGMDAFVGADEIVAEPLLVGDMDALEGTDNCAREVGLYTGVT